MDEHKHDGRRGSAPNEGAAPTTPTPISGGPGSSRSSGPDVSSARFFAASEVHEPMPETIGPYRIIRELGRGGMGAVYLAVREDDRFRRQVALKVIKRGMDTEEILRRFQLERQVLSALTHPNIARLLDGGAMDDGRPYFVLEYIEGQTIDAFCDANGLNVEQRLQLFQKVCSAVHYAHQNLVIHRDIKPHNILVTLEGEPKLLDFGIAKLINSQLMQITVATGPQLRLMTPEYASPEQVRGSPVSTSTDVYSLGALLYEILTGHRPYRFESRIEQEIVRVVCEVDPERPSSAVSRIEELRSSDGGTRRVTPETVSRVREGDPTRLRRRLSGDLDDIVLKAMEKAPPKRYLSAQQMAEDIQRHIDGMPVTARAGRGAAYRAAKFLRRNRGLVNAAAVVVLALLIGLLTTSWQWREAARERRRAESAAEASRQVVDGFTNSVMRVDGLIAASDGASGADRFDATLARLEELHREVELQDPQTRAALQRGLISVAMLLGDREGGSRGPSAGDVEAAMRAYAVAEKMLARTPSETSEGLRQTFALQTRLGDGYRRLGRATDAGAAFERAEAAARTLAARDGDPVAMRRMSVAMHSSAEQTMQDGDPAGALPALEKIVEMREEMRRSHPSSQSRRDLGTALATLGDCLRALGRDQEAEAMFRRSVEERRSLLADDPIDRHKRDFVVVHVWFLGDLLLDRGDAAGALAEVERVRPLAEQLVADSGANARSHVDLVEVDAQTLRALRDLGRIDEARAYADQASRRLAEARRLWPRDTFLPRQEASFLLLRGDLEAASSRFAESAAWFARAVDAYRGLMPPDPGELEARALGTALWRLGVAEQRAAAQAAGDARHSRLQSALSAFRESLSQHAALPSNAEAIAELSRLIAQCEQDIGD